MSLNAREHVGGTHPGLAKSISIHNLEYDEALLCIKTRIARLAKTVEKHPVPTYLEPPCSAVGRIVFNSMCLVSFGYAGMAPIWAAIMLEEEGDESAWMDAMQQMIDRFTNMNVVVCVHLSNRS